MSRGSILITGASSGLGAEMAWQFAAPDPERRERTALRIIALSFFGLAAYVSVDAALSLAGLREPEHSPVGITLAAISLIVMPTVSWIERRTGRELGSRSVQADATQLLLCIYLSGTVLIGLLLNALFGWAWADSVAALVVVLAVLATAVDRPECGRGRDGRCDAHRQDE